MSVNKKGKMAQKFELPTSDSAIFNRITTDLEAVEIGDRSFIIVPEVTRGSILVYEIDKTGRLTLVEQENPGRFDGWSSSEAIEVFEENGNHYAVAGGYGNGIGVFEISDGGALTEVDEYTYPVGGIRFTYDLDVRDLADGRQYIFASTATQDEVRSFRFIAEDNAIATGKKRGNGTDEDDQIFGSKGNNILKGREGDDMIEGRAGNDRILGEDGEDNLFGGDGRDVLRGGEDYDFLFGDAGRDRLFGENGNDVAHGGSGNDRGVGEEGNERLFGGSGREQLDGGGGDGVLTDGTGSDRLTGGTGDDRFVFWKDGKIDTITDYEDNRDKIDLIEFGRGLEFSDLLVRQAGTAVEVDVMGETIIVNSATGQISDFELSLGDFVFAV
ncbi:MAG: calcium-binding protein [Tateyamaria sp.]